MYSIASNDFSFSSIIRQAAVCYFEFNDSKIEAPIINKCLAQGHNKRTCRHVLHTIPLMLNVKHGNCKYQILKTIDKGLEIRS